MIVKAKRIFVYTLLAALNGFTRSANSHHSLAEQFDIRQPVRLEGSVIELRLENPHALLILRARDSNGNINRWTVIGSSVAALADRGVTRNSLPSGAAVSVSGFRSRDGHRLVTANYLFANDKTIPFGISR
jgi:hypothetical protein